MTRKPRYLLPALACSLGGCVGPQETLLIFIVVILLFGASRLPQLGRALGETLRAFRGAASGGEDDEQARAEQARLSASRKATPIEGASARPIDEAREDARAEGAGPTRPRDDRRD